jgi:hypothetical protein
MDQMWPISTYSVSGLVDQVQKFLGAIDGIVLRFAVSQGSPETERSVRESIAAGLAGLIADHRAAVDAFGADTRPETITRAAERIRTSKFKVEAYATLLGEQRANLEAELKTSATHLKAKMAEIGKATPIKSVADAKIAAGTTPHSMREVRRRESSPVRHEWRHGGAQPPRERRTPPQCEAWCHWALQNGSSADLMMSWR